VLFLLTWPHDSYDKPIATTLTQQESNIILTIVTTPHNTSRFSQTFSQTRYVFKYLKGRDKL
jgi:hypothetical protein